MQTRMVDHDQGMDAPDKAIGRLLAMDVCVWSICALATLVLSIATSHGDFPWLILLGLPIGYFVMFGITLMLAYIATYLVHASVLSLRGKRDFASEENRKKDIRCALCVHALLIVSPLLYGAIS